MALGGPQIFLASLHLTSAFPGRSGLINAFLNGAFDASSVVFKLFKISLSNHGVSIHTVFLIYLIVPLASLAYSVFMMSRTALSVAPVDDDDDFQLDQKGDEKGSAVGSVTRKRICISVESRSFRRQVLSEVFGYVAWLFEKE